MISLIAADTSTPFLSLTLLVAGSKQATQWQLAEQILVPIPTDRDDWFHTAVNNLLNRQHHNQLAALAIGRGPGAFTGLRISFSYFRTLAALQDIPLVPFSSLEYWRACFPIDDKQPFLTRINRNLFYGSKTKGGDFKALPLGEWYHEIEEANVWCDTWRDNVRFPVLESDWPRFRFLNSEMLNCHIPDLPSPADLFSATNPYPWHECHPEYGHELPFLKNPVQARK